MTPLQSPDRWTERRAARLASIIVSAAVVVADVALVFAFLRYLPGTIPGRWMVLLGIGIIGIFLFAFRRVIVHVRLFRRGL